MAPNLLAEHAPPTGPDQIWVTNITYRETAAGWLWGTQNYLPTARSRVDELILKGDWTHRKPQTPKLVTIPRAEAHRDTGDETAA